MLDIPASVPRPRSSMGPIAARKLSAIVDNTAHVLAIEASIAARALDLREAKTSEPLQRVHAAIRKHVAPFTGDRSMTAELESLAKAIKSGALREAAGVPIDPALTATE